MAQLIKLQDYISRYEVDPKRYPTQYVRLKQAKWQRMKTEWEEPEVMDEWEAEELVLEDKPRTSFFNKINPFKRKKKELDYEQLEEEAIAPIQKQEDKEPEEEEVGFSFNPNLLYRPQTVQELRRMYMDQLFAFQLNWASSTMREKSNVEPKYQRDTFLKQLLQELPDTFFVFYEPIFLLQKAPVELGVILVTPTDCYCIQPVEAEERATFSGSHSDRFWMKLIGENQKKIVNPMISLNRMESVMKSIFDQHQVKMNIQKIVLSRNGYVDYPGSSYDVQFIDRRNFPTWFEQLGGNRAPMKHMQFRALESLIQHVQTTSFLRAEWFTEGGEK
ncbi:MAG: NERD domain-containing protein [Kurthia sp.]|nr:NERD domain-containing protein [Candidatus Kurthia equi]